MRVSVILPLSRDAILLQEPRSHRKAKELFILVKEICATSRKRIKEQFNYCIKIVDKHNKSHKNKNY